MIVEMKLKDLCRDERPREKMLGKGVFSLSNAELLAVLLRSGTSRMNVVDVAREVRMKGDGKLGRISAMSVEKLCGFHGIGPDKACSIAAAFELGKTCAEEEAFDVKGNLTSSEKVFRLMLPRMKNLDREECWILMLNRMNRLLGKERITTGSMESTLIDNSAIARRCMEKHACATILVHNHPSGSAYPSEADIRSTEQLRRTLDTCGVRLLDHVIISRDSWYSFADESVQSKKFCLGEK